MFSKLYITKIQIDQCPGLIFLYEKDFKIFRADLF